MTVPAALVHVVLDQLTFPALTGALSPFVIAAVGRRRLGRTAPLAAGSTSATLGAPTFEHTIAVQGGQSVSVMAELWDDRGDAAPVLLGRVAADVLDPWATPTAPVTGTQGAALTFTVTATPLPAGGRTVRAARHETNPLALGRIAAVTITDIRGLYQPGLQPGTARRASPRPGYTSEDDLGRVYLNRDISNAWASDTQLIELTASIDVPRGRLPAGAKVRWTVIDPDDPSNDFGFGGAGFPPASGASPAAPDFHARWSEIVDANDTSSGAARGATGSDNQGSPAPNPRWEQIGSARLTVDSAEVARTTIVRSGPALESAVRIHCPSTAGDNLIVRAEVVDAPHFFAVPAETGIMTMWHRMDGEVIAMTGAMTALTAAHAPDLATVIPPNFEPACVQLDLSAPRLVADVANIGTSEASFDAELQQYMNTTFTHARDGGWFLLLVALGPYPAATVPATMVGATTISSYTVTEGVQTATVNGVSQQMPMAYIDVWDYYPTAQGVQFQWTTPASPGTPAASHHAAFGIRWVQGINSSGVPVAAGHHPAKSRLWLQPKDLTPVFTAATGNDSGSMPHAYSTRRFFYPRDYGIPLSGVHRAELTLLSAGSGPTGGISPTLSDTGGASTNTNAYFVGRTALFTTTSSPAQAASFFNHELCHGLGMPHKCGHWDYRAPRDRSCAMNYGESLLLDDAMALLVPGSSDHVGERFCGRHIREMRRARLQDNPALRTLGW